MKVELLSLRSRIFLNAPTHLKITLLCFILIMAVSTIVSFTGYYYLTLSNEFRERNFVHLQAANDIRLTLARYPLLRDEDIPQLSQKISIAHEQAQWCLDVLSPLEIRIFRLAGAADAVDICRRELENTSRFHALINMPSDEARGPGVNRDDLHATLSALIAEIDTNSRSFHPFIGQLQRSISTTVIWGTVLVVVVLILIFLFLSLLLLRSHHLERAQTQRLKDIAFTDPLTRLPNRRAVVEALSKRKNDPRSVTVIKIGLDHFKYINETLGRDAGDHVLREIALILRTETEGMCLAKSGGDEFIILLAPDQDMHDAEVLAQRIHCRIQEPIIFGGHSIYIDASVGISGTETGLISTDDILVAAYAALDQAKDLGRNQIAIYTEDMHETIINRRLLASHLKRAIVSEEFEPYFQLQVDAHTQEISGVEALARWHSPELGCVMPNMFLPLAERMSLIEDIDQIIFRKAIAQIQTLRAQGYHIPKLSLNFTARRLCNKQLVKQVEALELDGLQLGFEIVETVLVEDQPPEFHTNLAALRALGVWVEVDDFGSGHASVTALMDIRPDAMKLDRRLISESDTCEAHAEVLAHIVRIGKSMALTIIAEGIETSDQAEFARQIGCDVLQGFLYGCPMPATELQQMLQKSQDFHVSETVEQSDA